MEINTKVEQWLLYTKCCLIGFIIFNNLQLSISTITHLVLYILTYCCLVIGLLLIDSKKMKWMLHFICLVFVLLVASKFPLFFILFPITMLEINESSIWRYVFIFIPLIWIRENAFYLYAELALLQLIVYLVIMEYKKNKVMQEAQIDKMRQDIQVLTRKLNNQEQYIQQSQYTVKLEERNRISQEIHDNVGHSITGAIFQMEAVKMLLNRDIDKAKEMLQNAISISKEGIESIRVTLKHMKPATEQMGLHRMKLQLQTFHEKNGVEVNFTHEGNLQIITPIQWKLLNDNLLESLTNTLKYAKATKVEVSIQVLNKLVTLRVKDNGVGAVSWNKNLGILGMEERTATLSGRLIIDGTDGFSTTTLLPLNIN